MPFFRYSTTDAKGQLLEGTIQAGTPDEALFTLSQRGYPNARLIDPAPVAARVTSAQPTPSAPVKQTFRTRKGSDKERFVLFNQISRQLRAGINPARSFEEIGRVTHSNLYRESLLRVAENAKAGGTISDVLEQYPNLYPEHVVGTVRAGEAGGFLPDAAQQVANQAEEAHKFKRFFWFMWLVSGNALLVIPLILAVRVALLEAFDGVINGPNVPSFLGVLIKNLIWPFGPTTILLYLVLLAIRAALSTYEARKFRHEMGLRVPVLGPRARNESVTIFSWAMSKLAKGGMPPYRMWSMAADAVPNLAMKERLLRAGSQLHAGSRISEAVFGSKLFPEEYAPVLSTGELTGDITGALDQMASATRADYDAQTAYAKFRGIGCGCTVVAVVYGIIIIVLSKTYYQDMISKALEAIGEP